MLLDSDSFESDLNIGIIDGGISKNNTFLKPYIKVREEYVSTAYINESHATFIASTIQYGNKLNGISCANVPHFNFIDIVAIPNSDKNYIRLILSVKKNLWKLLKRSWINMQHQLKCGNMSLGIENKVCNGTMSDLGIFLDYIQDRYGVQIFVSSGNLNQLPLREWPAQSTMGGRDRIISPADSVRAITVGAIALYESSDSIVKSNEPSPF